MVKKILYLVLFCSSILSFSQETKATIQPGKMDSVYTQADQVAELPGGINEFRNKFQNEFKISKLNGVKGQIKTEIKFIIEKDGSTSNFTAEGNNENLNKEALRAAKGIKLQWTPAKINGQAVRYRFRMPLTLSFE